MELHRKNATDFVVLDASQADVLELAGRDLGEVFLLGPDKATTNQRVVSEAPSRRHVVVLGEELSQVDNGSTGANLRLEAIDESSHVLNELTLAFTES